MSDQASGERPPNVVLLMSDQQKFSASALADETALRTPATDRLAAEGVRFPRYFVQNPTCIPSRASLFTGTYPQEHEWLGFQTGKADRVRRMDQIQTHLADRGYHCGAVGHFHEGAGFENGWEYTLDFGDPPLSEAFGVVNEYAKLQAPESAYGNVGWWSGTNPLPVEETVGALTTDAAIDYLDGAAEEPFFLHVAHTDPHPPYAPAEPYDSLYDPADVELPPEQDRERTTDWHEQLAREAGMELCDDEDLREAIAAYYGMVTQVEHEFERLLDRLEEEGLLDRTWVVCCSDHGDFTGDHGLTGKADMFFDSLVHVPLTLRAPEGALPRGTVCDEFVESVDIFPTICDAAGVEVPAGVSGRSVLPWARGERSAPFKEAVFGAAGRNLDQRIHSMPQGMSWSSRLWEVATMVRTAEGKLVRTPEHDHELYVYGEDPDELANRYGEPEVAALQSRLADRLDAWLAEYPVPEFV